jgi:hypothetical protein
MTTIKLTIVVFCSAFAFGVIEARELQSVSR